MTGGFISNDKDLPVTSQKLLVLFFVCVLSGGPRGVRDLLSRLHLAACPLLSPTISVCRSLLPCVGRISLSRLRSETLGSSERFWNTWRQLICPSYRRTWRIRLLSGPFCLMSLRKREMPRGKFWRLCRKNCIGPL